jgi:hypothetical protein
MALPPIMGEMPCAWSPVGVPGMVPPRLLAALLTRLMPWGGTSVAGDPGEMEPDPALPFLSRLCCACWCPGTEDEDTVPEPSVEESTRLV